MEKTKKQRRVKVNYTISEDSANRIEKFIQENNLDKSSLVEKLLLEYMNSKKINFY